MRKNKVFSGISILSAVCIGAVAAVLVSLIGSGVTAALISNNFLDENSTTVFGISIQFLSAAIGAIIAAILVTQKKLLSCCLVDGLYIFVLLAVAILSFSGVTASVFSGIFACLLGCVTAIFITNRRKKRGNSIKDRRGHR